MITSVQVAVDKDVERAADQIRPMLALYIGGMGAREANFHNDLVARMGFEREARTIQDHYLAGRRREAVAAVPTRLVEALALIGPVEQIRDDIEQWKSSLVTTMLVSGPPPVMRLMAEMVLA